MPLVPNPDSVAEIVRLAVAPVFLLSGIGSILTVLTNRLARVIDRSRILDEKLANGAADAEAIHAELATLAQRAKFIGRAITLCTLTAIEICMVIVILFLDAFVAVHFSIPVAILFIAAMFTFILGLLMFLREIMVATATRRIGPKKTSSEREPTTVLAPEKPGGPSDGKRD